MDDETTLNEQALVPLRQQTVDFYGDPITAAQGADETIYVPLRPIVEHLGLDWSSPVKRLRRDAVLTHGIRSVVITGGLCGRKDHRGQAALWA